MSPPGNFNSLFSVVGRFLLLFGWGFVYKNKFKKKKAELCLFERGGKGDAMKSFGIGSTDIWMTGNLLCLVSLTHKGRSAEL